jgi:Zn-dependent protease with chaperone function
MDFFEAQARAKKRTTRLVLLFGLALIGTIAATYAAAVLIMQGAPALRADRSGGVTYFEAVAPGALAWWHPGLFAGVAAGTLAVVGTASLYKWYQYSAGGRAVADSVGARLVAAQTTDPGERRLVNVVEEMAIASGVPVPAVYVLDNEPAINAFAAGLTTSDAVVAVTRGTLEKLSRDELQGVVAHEFSHILNGDMRLNMRLTALVFGILVLGLVGRTILWGSRTRTRSRGKGTGGIMLAGVALMVVGYIGYFFGRIVQAAVSRQREFLADASAVQFTRNPGGIAGALKKIGGYALGSSLLSNRSTEVRHFLFAQGFRRGFTGWWSTHPPLPERIRAIEPQFDGRMFEPPEVVDVARKSFQAAGLAGAPRAVPTGGGGRVSGTAAIPGGAASRPIPFHPTAAIAAIGMLTPEQIDRAHHLLEELPADLREAAHSPGEAPVIVFALLLDEDPAIRARQRHVVSTRRGAEALALLDKLEPAVRTLPADRRLPMLQLTLPVLRQIPASSLDSFLEVLDELVHADEKVSTFEFALQKLLVHTLELSRSPAAAGTQYHSFVAVADEISTVLSAVAGAATNVPDFPPQAFAAGVAKLPLIQDRLRYRAATDFVALDAALDKLAAASLPIKQRTLTAAAHVVNADGRVVIEEVELLRAISAALDCPMPPLGLAAAG